MAETTGGGGVEPRVPRLRGAVPTGEPGNTVAASPPPQFFTDHRRGEVNELRQMLRLAQADRTAIQRQRDAVKRVIAFMTLGIDVAPLFSEMVMACSSNDIVQKKLIYLYLANYAETNPQLSLMTVNTFLKDSHDDDPAVRALALRSLCSLRSPAVLEYVEPALRRGLGDRSGGVRRTAVMGVVKLWQSNEISVTPALILSKLRKMKAPQIDELVSLEPDLSNAPLLEILFALIEDRDAGVAANAITALNEILSREGGIPFTRRMIAHLVNRIRDFDEWGQCTVLNLMANYVPDSDDELYDLLTILELRLKHSSSAVVLAAARFFVQAAEAHPSLRCQLILRLKSPLQTLTASASNESAYVVLSHLLVLLKKEKALKEALSEDFKMFYCGYRDPSYVKSVKLDLLISVVTEANVAPILEELSEYVVTEMDMAIASQAMTGLGSLGRRFQSATEAVVAKLLPFLELGSSQLAAAALVEMQKLLRCFPELSHKALPILQQVFATLSAESEGAAAAVWIIGQFCDDFENAPYLLEDLVQDCVDSTGENNETGSSSGSFTGLPALFLKELVFATTKTFLARPAETQRTLATLLSALISSDAVNFDARDLALYVYRYLFFSRKRTRDLKAFKTLMLRLPPYEQSSYTFLEDGNVAGEASGEEFNTLSLLFQKPMEAFVKINDPINFNGRFVPPATVLAAAAAKGSEALDDETSTVSTDSLDDDYYKELEELSSEGAFENTADGNAIDIGLLAELLDNETNIPDTSAYPQQERSTALLVTTEDEDEDDLNLYNWFLYACHNALSKKSETRVLMGVKTAKDNVDFLDNLLIFAAKSDTHKSRLCAVQYGPEAVKKRAIVDIQRGTAPCDEDVPTKRAKQKAKQSSDAVCAAEPMRLPEKILAASKDNVDGVASGAVAQSDGGAVVDNRILAHSTQTTNAAVRAGTADPAATMAMGTVAAPILQPLVTTSNSLDSEVNQRRRSASLLAAARNNILLGEALLAIASAAGNSTMSTPTAAFGVSPYVSSHAIKQSGKRKNTSTLLNGESAQSRPRTNSLYSAPGSSTTGLINTTSSTADPPATGASHARVALSADLRNTEPSVAESSIADFASANTVYSTNITVDSQKDDACSECASFPQSELSAVCVNQPKTPCQTSPQIEASLTNDADGSIASNESGLLLPKFNPG